MKEILVRSNPNWLLTHLSSLMSAYELFKKHLESQINMIAISPESQGVAVGQRIPYYFKTVQPPESDKDMRAIKERIFDVEFDQIGRIGMSVVYSLKEVYDVNSVVINGAKVWISSGILVIAAGICFPPAIPYTGPFGGSLISEGFTDIAI